MNLTPRNGSERLAAKFAASMKDLKFIRSIKGVRLDEFALVFLTDRMLDIEITVNRDTGICTIFPDAKIADALKASLISAWNNYVITTQEDLDSKFAAFKADYVSKL